MPAPLPEDHPFYQPYITQHEDEILVEVWADVPDWKGYQVSTLGRIRSYLTKGRRHKPRVSPKMLKPVMSTDGYRAIFLCGKGKPVFTNISRLVLLAFLGNDSERTYALHNNGTPDDDRLINLRWGTQKDNADDCKRHGRRKCGEAHRCAKLDCGKVLEIRRLSASGVSNKELSSMYEVDRSVISRIISRNIWKHVTDTQV